MTPCYFFVIPFVKKLTFRLVGTDVFIKLIWKPLKMVLKNFQTVTYGSAKNILKCAKQRFIMR